ncbi:MAG: LysR family transcriptional regulator [Rubrobacter sp.]|jgi:DNA-binding transcriptional LysR family regulator|nr:LysR family transcriptional regulator [Rubrobacter sp.]MBA3952184.1 LysR family transcriptional regulator [Rubrobacter sp.]MDQ3360481.1 LysR substrate-binding domain-containing protein [Actinomycetota bacterium]
MELRHLRYFVAVAEELNFSRAAGRMYLSQPALSQQIRKLEQELGVALFHRTNNLVALTEAGLTLLEGARRVLVLVEQTSREAREVGGAEVRHLRVGFPEYANHTPVADALQTFRRRYPYVELEEHETFTLQETLQQIDKLHKGTLDVGFMLSPEADDVIQVEHVLDIELVAALPEGHPLAGRDVISMRDLSDERLILFSRTFHPRSYDYVVGCCREAGFEPKVVQRKEPQLYSGATTYRMVASGIGVGIVARPVVSGYRPHNVVFKPLRDPAPALDLVAAWRRDDPSSNLQAFLEIVRELTLADARAAPVPEEQQLLET